MSKRKNQSRYTQLQSNLQKITAPAAYHQEIESENLLALLDRPIPIFADRSKNPRMKKFRFQLLRDWLITTFPPCKAADIGGGKGLLAYLLAQDGWSVTVIDPFPQPLPDKYKDIRTGERVKIPAQLSVPYLQAEFEVGLGKDFDLLLGMHAHGCNVKIIDAAAQHGCGFAIFPCCVIDEPFYPCLGVHWLESLADYAVRQGLIVQTVRLNFKGQNIGLYAPSSFAISE